MQYFDTAKYCLFFYLLVQIMTDVTSHQCLSQLIKEMLPGHDKDIVLRLCGQTDRSTISIQPNYINNGYQVSWAKKSKTTLYVIKNLDDIMVCLTFCVYLQLFVGCLKKV